MTNKMSLRVVSISNPTTGIGSSFDVALYPPRAIGTIMETIESENILEQVEVALPPDTLVRNCKYYCKDCFFGSKSEAPVRRQSDMVGKRTPMVIPTTKLADIEGLKVSCNMFSETGGILNKVTKKTNNSGSVATFSGYNPNDINQEIPTYKLVQLAKNAGALCLQDAPNIFLGKDGKPLPYITPKISDV